MKLFIDVLKKLKKNEEKDVKVYGEELSNHSKEFTDSLVNVEVDKIKAMTKLSMTKLNQIMTKVAI